MQHFSITGYVNHIDIRNKTNRAGEPFTTVSLIIAEKASIYAGKDADGKAVYREEWRSVPVECSGAAATTAAKWLKKGNLCTVQGYYDWETTEEEEEVTSKKTGETKTRKVTYHRIQATDIMPIKTDAPDTIGKKKYALAELKAGVAAGWKGYTVEKFIEALQAQILELETPPTTTAPAAPTPATT